MAGRYEIELTKEADEDLLRMSERDEKRVERAIERALGDLGREQDFHVLVYDGVPSPVWRTYAVGPYTVIFGFLKSPARAARGKSAEATVVAAIPHQDRLDEISRRLVEQANPDDQDWE